MDKEKCIKEMAEHLIETNRNFDEYCTKPCRECELGGVVNCESHYKATALYNAGYRKCPGWISVEDRLPELETSTFKCGDMGYKQKSVRVLCACKQKSGKTLVKEGYYEVWVDDKTDPFWRIPGSIDAVTHWMPLPEPPTY